ncbi:MAG TPA: beta-ketoacyl synthase N-terminal-like domain-containing protein, partial [Chryseolinea sp.]|nr:beta-ketoacyl synthase N-terminal-like domain-containing protein [Chryseolinea sp.]
MMSAQRPWHREALGEQPVSYAGDRLGCIEPDYSKYFDVRQLRRMSRIIKMGMASGMDALREAAIDVPHAIITGTSYGCLEDTGIFLTKMIENQEQALNPTPFIQSTHNTVGSQIALLLQCQGYNQTYTQRAFSFESSLIDTSMSLEDNPQQSILTGAVDEITTTSHKILQRFDIFRTGSTNSLQLFKDKLPGTLNGEGSAFFVLSGNQGKDAVAMENVVTLYKPSATTLSNAFASCLEPSSLRPDDVDLVLVGKSGHITEDRDTDDLVSTLFPSSSHAVY